MGVPFSLERLSTRGALAPMVTHLTWSTLMVLALRPYRINERQS
jgi:hypothetical protein